MNVNMKKETKIKIIKNLIKLHIPFGRFSEENLKWKLHKLQLGYLASDAVFDRPKYYGWPHKIFIYENMLKTVLFLIFLKKLIYLI